MTIKLDIATNVKYDDKIFLISKEPRHIIDKNYWEWKELQTEQWGVE